MNKEDLQYLESLLASLRTGLDNMKAGSTTEKGYMLEKLHAMARVLSHPVPAKVDTRRLKALVRAHESAVRDYAFARGLKSGLNKTGRFLRNPENCIMDYAEAADDAEAELNDFIDSL